MLLCYVQRKKNSGEKSFRQILHSAPPAVSRRSIPHWPTSGKMEESFGFGKWICHLIVTDACSTAQSLGAPNVRQALEELPG